MPFDDDFQGYSVGDTVPFGDWILDTGAFTKSIVSGFAPTGMTQSLQLIGTVALNPTLTGYINQFSEFCAVRKTSGGDLFSFSNGPNSFGHTFNLLRFTVESDGTVSAYIGTTLLKNSYDGLFEFFAVNFFQLNVEFSDALVAGLIYVRIQCQVALNGTKILDFDITTNVQVVQLANGTSEVNHFQLTTNGANYAAFTLQNLTALVSYPHPGSPNGLVFQAVTEVDELPSNTKIRVHQAVTEVDELPSTAKIRIFQAVTEVDCKGRGGHRAEYIHRRHFPGD